jgi:transposase-like protein
MPENTIQFQRGLSLEQFFQRYGTERQCEQALIAARWPQGWRCPRCDCKRSVAVNRAKGRRQWECLLCGYQCTSIVGTVMEHTRLPLRLWFEAMYQMRVHKNAISALWLMRQLDVSATKAPGCSSTS